MGAGPGQQLQAPLHDQGGQHGDVDGIQAGHAAVPLQPVVDPMGQVGVVLEKAQGRSQVVQVPAHATVVEVDDAGAITLHQQVGQAQVCVDQAKA
ncbi:hypothetical protein D3C80_1615930 [compost metagenome]